MKKITFLTPILVLFTVLLSCNDKKLTEVVDVPLPSAPEKVSLGLPDDVKADEGPFQLERLPYRYDALAPNISAVTLEMHYSKHYLNYTNNLNRAIKGTPFETQTIEEILSKLDINDADIRNNAGGYYNHSMYWQCMAPKAGGEPKDTLAGAITKRFGSFANFSNQFKAEATRQTGSAWIWLVVDSEGQLQLTSTQNQDNPLMTNGPVFGYHGKPILAFDLWEHAYYLDYQYKRKNYIDAFFNLINWKKVGENYEATFKK